MMFVPAAAGAAEDAGEEGGRPAAGGAEAARVFRVTTHPGTGSYCSDY